MREKRLIDKGLFIKLITDTNKINGFYMDDYTASLLFDHFYDMDTAELESICTKLKKAGEKATYKTILANRKERKKTEEIEKPNEVVYEDCNDDCKICKRLKVACVKMNIECNKIVDMIMKGDINWKDAMLVLHEKYPTVGFDKKIGRCTGVIWNEDGNHLPVYTYD